MSPTGFSHNWIHSSRGLEGSSKDDSHKYSLDSSELNDPSNFLGERPRQSSANDNQAMNNMMFPKQGSGVYNIDQDQPKKPVSHHSDASSLASTRSIMDEPLVCNPIVHETMPGRYSDDSNPQLPCANGDRRRSLTQSISKLFRKQNE